MTGEWEDRWKGNRGRNIPSSVEKESTKVEDETDKEFMMSVAGGFVMALGSLTGIFVSAEYVGGTVHPAGFAGIAILSMACLLFGLGIMRLSRWSWNGFLLMAPLVAGTGLAAGIRDGVSIQGAYDALVWINFVAVPLIAVYLYVRRDVFE